MNILVDIGNTRLKYCQVNNDSTPDAINHIQGVNVNLLSSAWFDSHWQQAKQLIIASVNQPMLLENIVKWAKQKSITVQLVSSEAKAFGVKSGYLMPERLGVDRWLALIGAKALYPEKNLIIVDAGTATTVDILTINGQHLGGWILPGIESMHQSVLKDTVQVKGQLKQANLAFANNTADNVNNACWAATIGLIKVAIEQVKILNLILGDIIVTGGNSNSLSRLLDVPHQCHEELIFYGLQRYSKTAISVEK